MKQNQNIIGDNFRRFREYFHLSLRMVAGVLEVSPTKLSNFETGKSKFFNEKLSESYYLYFKSEHDLFAELTYDDFLTRDMSRYFSYLENAGSPTIGFSLDDFEKETIITDRAVFETFIKQEMLTAEQQKFIISWNFSKCMDYSYYRGILECFKKIVGGFEVFASEYLTNDDLIVAFVGKNSLEKTLDEIFNLRDLLLGWIQSGIPSTEPESPPELTADDHLDRAIKYVLGSDISDDLNEEMKYRLNAVLHQERKELRHRDFLRNFESLIELALDSSIDRNNQTETQKLQQQELVRRNRRGRLINRFEVRQYLYDYGLIKTKSDTVLHRIENEIMKKRDRITMGELEDYIRDECETQSRLDDDNPAASAG